VKIKVGDLVSVRSHLAGNAHSGESNSVMILESKVGVVTSRLNGEGYYDVLLSSGKVIFTSYANLEVIDESR
jgi:hypothetical protein